MRVIAGSARSLRLETVDSMDTRPTTDRIKETLFNILSPYIRECRFLDMFAGSGAIGIEALSRGAEEAVFVENEKKALSCIHRNLEFTHLDAKAQVIAADAVSAVGMLEKRDEPFDIIFMDPPYGRLLEKALLCRLADSPIAGMDTLFIVESNLDTTFEYADRLGLEVVRVKKYKTNKHTFLYRKAGTEKNTVS